MQIESLRSTDFQQTVEKRREAFAQRHKVPLYEGSSYLGYREKSCYHVDSSLEKPLWFTEFPDIIVSYESAIGEDAVEHLIDHANRALETLENPPKGRYNQNEWISAPINFNAEEYARLCGDTYQKHGKNVGYWFSYYYGGIVKGGLEPQAYYSAVERALALGGRKFAEWFIYNLLIVGREKQDIGEFMESIARVAEVINKKVGKKSKMLTKFASAAPLAVAFGNMTFAEFSARCVVVIEEFDETTAYWAVGGIAATADSEKTDYSSDAFLSDLRALYTAGDEMTRSLASWYASGLERLHRPKRLADEMQKTGKHVRELINWRQDPLAFRQNFAEFVQEKDKGGAIFYSKMSPAGDELKDALFVLRQNVSLKVYKSALWIIGQGADWSLLKNLLMIYQSAGENEALRRLRYSLPAIRKGERMWSGLLNPDEHRRQKLYDPKRVGIGKPRTRIY